jgi:hypothetical protein
MVDARIGAQRHQRQPRAGDGALSVDDRRIAEGDAGQDGVVEGGGNVVGHGAALGEGMRQSATPT